MTRSLTIFSLGCTIGAAAYAVGSSGYQPGMIAILTLLWLCLMVANVGAFLVLCVRAA